MGLPYHPLRQKQISDGYQSWHTWVQMGLSMTFKLKACLRRVKPSTVRPLCRHTSPERKHGIPSKFKWNKTRGNIPIHGLDHATMKVRNPLPEIELVMYGKAINVRTEYYEGSGGSAPQVLKMPSLKEPEHGWELHILTCGLGRIIQPGCEACSSQALESL